MLIAMEKINVADVYCISYYREYQREVLCINGEHHWRVAGMKGLCPDLYTDSGGGTRQVISSGLGTTHMSSSPKGMTELKDHLLPNSLQLKRFLRCKTIYWGLTSALSMACEWIHFTCRKLKHGEVKWLSSGHAVAEPHVKPSLLHSRAHTLIHSAILW